MESFSISKRIKPQIGFLLMLNVSSLWALYLVCTGAKNSTLGLHALRCLTQAGTLNCKKVGTCKNLAYTLAYRRFVNSGKTSKSSLHSGQFPLDISTMEFAQQLKNNKAQCDNLLRRRFFYANSFEIYGGTAGLFDYGPPGCALKAHLENLWRQHFIVSDEMLEVSCPCITPYSVLKASGHVDRFTDLMVVDKVTGECFRADKYLEDVVERLLAQMNVGNANKVEDGANKIVMKDVNAKLVSLGKEYLEHLLPRIGNMTQAEVKNFLEDYNIVSPQGNPLSDPFPFNLMFQSTIGPKSNEKAVGGNVFFLRPETAQGIFVNFVRLLEQNGGKMPFACAQIGLGFRNEISPRNGLLRVREFLMAEIEYFVHPENKSHAKFPKVAHQPVTLLTRASQEAGDCSLLKITMGEAVSQGIVANEALGYFLARTQEFLTRVGINNSGIRFRQHMSDEMAHYACDCWDAEILTSYGWIEVAGHADRMAYDLSAHSKATNIFLVASQRFDTPRQVEKVQATYNRALIGKSFGKANAAVVAAIDAMPVKEAMELEYQLQEKGTATINTCDDNNGSCDYIITRDMVSITTKMTTVCEETFTPSVIEPSFGLGRLIFCILEHAYRIRPAVDAVQEQRAYLAIAPQVAPIKCVLLPLSAKDVFDDLLLQLQEYLASAGISYKVDKTGASIGKRYARNDEIGVPYAITIDFQSVTDKAVTLRERDSMQQVRVPFDKVASVVAELLVHFDWNKVTSQYPIFTLQQL